MRGDHIDVVAPQDGTGPTESGSKFSHATLEQLPVMFEATKKAAALANPNIKLWVTNEAYVLNPRAKINLEPMGIASLVADMRAVQPYVTNYVTFSFPKYLDRQHELYYTAYKAYLETGRVEMTPPSAPPNLRAVITESFQVKLDWDEARDDTGVAGYLISRNGEPVAAKYRGSPDYSTSLLDDGGGPGDAYEINAFDAAGNLSAPSDITIPSEIASLKPSAATGARSLKEVSPSRRGIPSQGHWLVSYGSAKELGDLNQVANTFRTIIIDVDPHNQPFTTDDIKTLKGKAGQNRVLSYLNIGACENWREYWGNVSAGFKSCKANTGAQLGPYSGYDEVWMNPGNAEYQKLILDYVAPRLAAQGIDGFFFDNLEVIESNAKCKGMCKQGGLDLIRKLREKYPSMLFVMNNATGDLTRTGVTGGVPFRGLLDGVIHESVYTPSDNKEAIDQLLKWKALNLKPGGQPFFIGTLDFIGSCDKKNTSAALKIYDRSKKDGFSPYIADASNKLREVCYWDFLK